jgi:hypothetical protein
MDAAAAAESVNGLTNNSSFADHDYRWQASAVGLLTHIRPLTRALYVATGQNEINQDQTTEPRTHPQMRADLMSYVTTAGLDAFMCMPADD